MDVPSGIPPSLYQPLQDSEIRLVDIHPLHKHSAAISCNLVQVHLESLPFTALSYVWGDPSNTVEILLDDKPFNVTINLEAYLRKAAQERAEDSNNTDKPYVWIDALCIDQGNVAERNSQVQMMGSIYSKATRVSVWLGYGGRDIKVAIDRIQELSRAIIELGGKQAVYDPEKRAIVSERFLDSMKDGSVAREALFGFFQFPWWTRTWVLQEIALAKNVTFLCGNETISFEDIYHTVLHVYVGFMEDPVIAIKNLRMSMEEEAAFARAAEVVNTRALFEHNYADRYKSTRLQSLLRSTERAKATDPRDKIYGLLGMISDSGKDELRPRYDVSVERLYLKVVIWFLKQYNSLSILGHCFCGYSEDLLPMPSWIPHWEPKDKEDEGPTPFHWEEYEDLVTNTVRVPYSASENSSLLSHNWSVDEESGTLSLTGAHLGTISFLSEPARLSASMAQADLFAQAKQWLGLDELLGKSYKVTGESTNLALRRSMVGDFHNRFISSQQKWKIKQRNFMLMLPDDPALERDGLRWDYKDSMLAFMNTVNKRRVALSSEGWIGLVPETAMVGDKVVVLIGGPVLYIVREKCQIHGTNDSLYSLVGEAYFHGFMDGKALDSRPLQTIILG